MLEKTFVQKTMQSWSGATCRTYQNVRDVSLFMRISEEVKDVRITAAAEISKLEIRVTRYNITV